MPGDARAATLLHPARNLVYGTHRWSYSGPLRLAGRERPFCVGRYDGTDASAAPPPSVEGADRRCRFAAIG